MKLSYVLYFAIFSKINDWYAETLVYRVYWSLRQPKSLPACEELTIPLI